MPRRPRGPGTDSVYHVLNRAVRRAPLFETAADYAAFERVLLQAVQRRPASYPGILRHAQPLASGSVARRWRGAFSVHALAHVHSRPTMACRHDARLAQGRSTKDDTKPFQSKLTRTSFASVDMLNGIRFVPVWFHGQKTGVGPVFGDGAISALTTFFTIGRYRRQQIGSNMSISHKPIRNCMRCGGQSNVVHRLEARNGELKPRSAWASIPSSADQAVRRTLCKSPVETTPVPFFHSR